MTTASIAENRLSFPVLFTVFINAQRRFVHASQGIIMITLRPCDVIVLVRGALGRGKREIDP
jgi:hypothetical protein